MLFHFGFYSSILLISFTQGIIYTFLLLSKAIKTENKSNYWLGVFVFLCSLYIAPWMLGFAGWYDNQPYRNIIFYTPLQQLFFIGPIIYFYTQSLLNPSFKFQKQHIVHLLPGIFYLIYSLIIFVYDCFIANEIYFYRDGMDKDFEQWYQISGQISMIFYFVLSLKYYSNYKKLVVEITSDANNLLFEWIKNYLIAFLIMLLLPLVFDAAGSFFPSLKSYEGSWWFYLFYSIVLCYIAITGYSNNAITKIGFHFQYYDKNLVYYLTERKTETVDFENIIDINHEVVEDLPNSHLEKWKTNIENLIDSESLFKNPELTLVEVAKKLNSNVALISKTINQGFGFNFNDFINNYRIEAVKEMFKNGEHKKSTLLGIAYDCGFNSKATFNRAFKKNTGFTPKEFLTNLNL